MLFRRDGTPVPPKKAGRITPIITRRKNMKKIIAITLALCLMMGSSAFALNYEQHFTND